MSSWSESACGQYIGVRCKHTITVGVAHPVLGAQRITLGGTEIIHLNHNLVGTIQALTRAVRLRSQTPAGATSRACSRAGADAELVLRDGSVVAMKVVPATGGASGVAAFGAPAIARTIFGESSSVFVGEGER